MWCVRETEPATQLNSPLSLSLAFQHLEVWGKPEGMSLAILELPSLSLLHPLCFVEGLGKSALLELQPELEGIQGGGGRSIGPFLLPSL